MMSRTCIALLLSLVLLGACGHGGPADVEFRELGRVSDTGVLFCCEEGEPLATLLIERNVPSGAIVLPFTGLTIHDVVPAQRVRFVVGERVDFDPEIDGYDFGLAEDDVEIEVWTDSCGIDEVSFRVRLTEFSVVEPFFGDFERDERGNIMNAILVPLKLGFEEIKLTRDPDCSVEPPAEDAILTIELHGSGSGQAMVNLPTGAGPTCTTDCQIVVPLGTDVGILATTTAPNVFSHFEGHDMADGEFASVTMNGDRTVKVFFEVG